MFPVHLECPVCVQPADNWDSGSRRGATRDVGLSKRVGGDARPVEGQGQVQVSGAVHGWFEKRLCLRKTGVLQRPLCGWLKSGTNHSSRTPPTFGTSSLGRLQSTQRVQPFQKFAMGCRVAAVVTPKHTQLVPHATDQNWPGLGESLCPPTRCDN